MIAKKTQNEWGWNSWVVVQTPPILWLINSLVIKDINEVMINEVITNEVII